MKRFIPLLLIAVTSSIQMTAQPALPRYGKDSAECVKNLSLFNEYYKQGAYTDAYESWKWVFENCPASSKNVYVRGASMLEGLIKAEKDAGRKKTLLDTLMMLYDRRITYFGEKGYVEGEKGLKKYEYAANEKDKQDALEILKQSIASEGNKTGPILLFRYFQLNTEMYNQKLVTKEQILDLYDQLGSIIDYNLENNSPDAADYEKSRTNIENFFGPFASCEDLIGIYAPRMKANPEDKLLIKKIVHLFERKKCLDAPVYLEATEKLYKFEPTASSAASLARMYAAKGNYSKASGLYNEAIDLDSSISKKALYHLELAELNLHKLKNYQQARVHAQRAASLRSGWGRPYIMIGDIYVAAASSCSDDDFKKAAVYWAAVDKYQQAKSIDPLTAEDANKRIATYSRYFPDKEAVFFRSLKEGETFPVDYCWINETTTVRIR
jgi:tetratricopeptide (TPR) repeat protein